MTIRRMCLVAGWLLWLSSASLAAINPNFTPLHMVKQSDSIVAVEVRLGEKPRTLTCRVEKVLKGKKADWKQPIVIDLSAAPHKAQPEAITQWVKQDPGGLGLFFVGTYSEEGAGGFGRQMAEAYLHMQGRWISLFRAGKGDGWEMCDIDVRMKATFIGKTDQWLRCVEYVLADPKATWPVHAMAEWRRQAWVATVGGRVAGGSVVDLGESLQQTLFMACEEADRLFEWDGKTLADVTAKRTLTSKSRIAAWGDFDGDGRLDLASWDGKTLALYYQRQAGRFAASQPVAVKIGECLGLAALDVGAKGRAGLLVSTADTPLLLSPDGQDGWKSAALDRVPRGATTKPDSPGACLLADFDNDGWPDVIQMFSNGSLLYRGAGLGKFAPGGWCDVALGEGRSAAWLGDWEHDGRIDIMCAAEDGTRVWHNKGEGKFEELRGNCGEFAYISQRGGIAGQSCDINNDGRPDTLVVYSGTSPHLFFNCGFRGLAHAYDLDLQQKGLLPEAEKGLQAGCVGDFNGDGAQDLAVVCPKGRLEAFYRKVFDDDPPRTVRVMLPAGAPGPVRVEGQLEHRSTGAWNLAAGASVPICREGAGAITLKWQYPGKPAREEKVKLADKPITFTLKP